jgi:hypothetical protein
MRQSVRKTSEEVARDRSNYRMLRVGHRALHQYDPDHRAAM